MMLKMLKMLRILCLTLVTNILHAAPYDWMNNPMITGYNKNHKETIIYSEKNPYQNGSRTTDNKGSVWITEQNPYNKKELRTRKIY